MMGVYGRKCLKLEGASRSRFVYPPSVFRRSSYSTRALFSILSSPHHKHPGFGQTTNIVVFACGIIHPTLVFCLYLRWGEGHQFRCGSKQRFVGVYSLRLGGYQTEFDFRLTDLVAAVVRAPANAALLRSFTACVDKYLDQCGRRWADL